MSGEPPAHRWASRADTGRWQTTRPRLKQGRRKGPTARLTSSLHTYSVGHTEHTHTHACTHMHPSYTYTHTTHMYMYTHTHTDYKKKRYSVDFRYCSLTFNMLFFNFKTILWIDRQAVTLVLNADIDGFIQLLVIRLIYRLTSAILKTSQALLTAALASSGCTEAPADHRT